MTAKSTVMVRFSIYGEGFDPELVTKQLGIMPSETHLKGDPIRDGKKTRKETAWVISTGYEVSININDQLNTVMTLLANKEQELIDLKERFDLKTLFMIVVNIEENDIPAMYFRTNFIDFASNIGAEIGFDTYIL